MTFMFVSGEVGMSGESVVAPSSLRKVRSPIGTSIRLPFEVKVEAEVEVGVRAATAADMGRLSTRRDAASRARRVTESAPRGGISANKDGYSKNNKINKTHVKFQAKVEN